MDVGRALKRGPDDDKGPTNGPLVRFRTIEIINPTHSIGIDSAHRLQRSLGRRRLGEVIRAPAPIGREPMAKTAASYQNRILVRLSSSDQALLEPDLEPATLTLRQVLEAPNKPIKHCYFINYGLASIIAAPD
jgi:hypothetical protein